MSSTRSCNKFCLTLDNSSSDGSSNTGYLNRWSEVVPPKTALTFAALWDPEEGMVTFSGAALLESESFSGRTPHPDGFDDDYSQLISLDRDMEGGAAADENTATLATFQDVFKAFLRHTPWDSREHLNMKSGQGASHGMQTRASSTFDGLDIYSHDVQVKSRKSLHLSCGDLLDMESSFRTSSAFGRLRLRSDLMLDAYRSDLENESTSGSRPVCLNSRFSTTTTSTSNYVDVAPGTAQSVCISETLSVPQWAQPEECVSPAGSWPFLPRRRRVLRKRRPFEGDVITTATSSTPCTPRRVTPKSSTWSSTSPTPSSPSPSPSPSASACSPSAALGSGRDERRPPCDEAQTPPNTPNTPSGKGPRLGLRFSLLPKRRSRRTSSDSDGWVCIEVTPIIRQRYIANLEED